MLLPGMTACVHRHLACRYQVLLNFLPKEIKEKAQVGAAFIFTG